MTLVFIGHCYKYELESICRLFYHCQRLELRYDAADLSGEQLILTRKKQGRTHTWLLAAVREGGRLYRRHLVIPNRTERYEKTCERLLCRLVFELLSELTGIRPAWGILTGIRPVKNLQWDEERGISPEESDRELREDYLVSEEKIRLCHMIHDLQRPIIAASQKNSVSLYISIPFCPSRCSYCSFVSHSIASKAARQMLPEYVDKIVKEIDFTAKMIAELGLKLETVYVGGGTPTTLSAEQLRQVCGEIAACFDLSALREYTVEAGRADTITEEKLRALKEAGVTRISINPQTFNDDVLAAIGRKHTAAEAIHCFELARRIGHGCINMDFIAGLPGDSYDSFCRTIEQALALGPENITVHTLTVKRSSELLADGGFSMEELRDPIADMVGYAQSRLLESGYLPYYLYKQKNTPGNLENVGYCRAGFEGYYNIYMMEEIHTVLACGGAAVTKLVEPETHRLERIFNYKYPYEYITHFDEVLRRKEKAAELYRREFLQEAR